MKRILSPSLLTANRATRGFTLIEIMVASAVMGFALVVMISMHSQAVRSNMHAKRMTDCTYLAQAQMEQLPGERGQEIIWESRV